jgi:hypothetical protein
MLVFITTPAHAYTCRALVSGRLGAALPRTRVISYDWLFGRATVPRATYIFSDLERLEPWQARLAGELYLRLGQAGLRCLNNPALVLNRTSLLRALHAAGVNPFTCWRAEDAPRPVRFPVFIRAEDDHGLPMSGLLATQEALDAELQALRRRGVPLRGLIVVEYCAQPISPGVWRKYGSFRIGAGYSLDHGVIEDRWLVKYGAVGVATDEMVQHEYDAVSQNVVPPQVQRAFDAAGIEYGRADHAEVEGQAVVYEINTNPHILPPSPQARPLRNQTLALARDRMARMFWQLDSGDGGRVRLEDGGSKVGLRAKLGRLLLRQTLLRP